MNTYKTWPFLEAKKILNRKLEQSKNNQLQSNEIIFETGYGPSGLPHIGTFCEVFRTSIVIAALKHLIANDEIANKHNFVIRLICFSDDMDGLKKVPSNIPNQDHISKYIGQPLTSVPDPFEEKSSYGAYMNDKLRSFLDKFGLQYEFMSSAEKYKSGFFNEALHKVALNYQKVMDIMLPSLGEERQKTYSPFLPICPKTNKVLQAKVIEVDSEKNEIVYINEDNENVRTSILNGNVKLQWKVDFSMRWMQLQVDYEMYGVDHQTNSHIYSKLCRALGGNTPLQFFYSLFLDSEGNKISKSKGNSISIDEWLSYAPIESLALYTFHSPEKSKRLYFDVIPKITDEYIKLNQDYSKMLKEFEAGPSNASLSINQETLIDKSIWLIHNAIFIKSKKIDINNVPIVNLGKINFTMLLNLASACSPENKETLYKFIKRYDASVEHSEFLDKLITGTMLYYENFIKPNKNYLQIDEQYKNILNDCINYLHSIEEIEEMEENIQNNLFAIGKKYYEPKDLKVFFSSLYQILLGQNDGPRLGSFIKLFGIKPMLNLINQKLNSST